MNSMTIIRGTKAGGKRAGNRAFRLALAAAVTAALLFAGFGVMPYSSRDYEAHAWDTWGEFGYSIGYTSGSGGTEYGPGAIIETCTSVNPVIPNQIDGRNVIAVSLNNSNLTSIDVSAATALEYLDVTNNHLTTLDLSNNGLLRELNIYRNDIGSIDKSQLGSLKELSMGSNPMSSFSASGLSNLESLDVSGAYVSGVQNYDSITYLDVSNSPKLSRVAVSYSLLNDFKFQNCPKLQSLILQHTYLASLDVSGVALKNLYVSDNAGLTSLTLGSNATTTYIICFRNSLTTLDASGLSQLDILGCAGNRLTSLSIPPNLGTLNCDDNNLSVLDTSPSSKLWKLTCTNNGMTSLTVGDSHSDNDTSFSIDCSNNSLTSLNLSHLSMPGTINCSHNNLTNISLPPAIGSYASHDFRYNNLRGGNIAALRSAGLSEGKYFPQNALIQDVGFNNTRTFAALKEGYAPAPSMGIIASNDTPTATLPLAVTLTGDDADCFTVSPAAPGSIAGGGQVMYTVAPKAGLLANGEFSRVYEATVSVKEVGGELANQFFVRSTVRPGDNSGTGGGGSGGGGSGDGSGGDGGSDGGSGGSGGGGTATTDSGIGGGSDGGTAGGTGDGRTGADEEKNAQTTAPTQQPVKEAAQPKNTLKSLKASKGKLSPKFKWSKASYKLKLTKKQKAAKITVAAFDKSAKVQIKVGKGKWKSVKKATVKLAKGKKTTVRIKVTAKGLKARTYKIAVSRAKR
jgi:hypothetical protein